MGIKGFSAWLRATFPQVFCSIPRASSTVLQFDQVYVDLNPFLHISARQSSSIDDVVKGCRRSLRSALQTVARPKSLVYVSMDGPAPLAKLPEQRARRQDAAINAARKGTFDAQQLTPGCLAMTTIEAQMYALLKDLFFKTPNSAFDFTAVIDGSCVDGEGEFKIIRRILHDHVEGDAMKGRVTRAILACDADLFLQALLSDVPHLYLIDPFAPFQSPTAIFSVDRWRRALSAESGNVDQHRQVAFDFVLFALMSGSDYAPALRYANYRSLWPNYLEFLKHSRSAKRTRSCASSGNALRTIVDPEAKNMDLGVLRDFFRFYVQQGLSETLQEPLRVFHDEFNADGKDERILNYLEHLLWNMEALVTCNVPDLTISMLSEKTAPTLLELADFDVDALQAALDERLKSRKANDNNNVVVTSIKYPGVMALLALDRSGTDCLQYIAEPLKPIMMDLKGENSRGYSELSDSLLLAALTERIDALPKDSFTLVEKLVTFPRSPVVLDRSNSSSPDAANFFSMALKSPHDGNFGKNQQLRLPWMRPYVYSVDEEESWRCPLHRSMFGKFL